MLYTVVRKCGLTPSQFLALPWWEQMVIEEGLEMEFGEEANGGD